MATISHRRSIDDVVQDLSKYEIGYLLTVNALTRDLIKHEGLISKICHYTNVHCYGKKYKNTNLRFRILGSNEIGTINQGLHSHLLLMNNNDTHRTFEQIKEFIFKKWYELIIANHAVNKYSNLVDIKIIYDLRGTVEYIAKTGKNPTNSFNFQYY